MRTVVIVAVGGVFAIAALATSASAQEIKVQETVTYYAVQGRSPDALLAQMRTLRPEPRLGGDRYFARADYNVYWRFRSGKRGGACAVESFSVGLELTYTYPQWTDREGAGERLVAYWDKFTEKLETHERGHGDIAVAGAEEIASTIHSLPPSPTCADLETAVDSAVQPIMESIHLRQEEYDVKTDHGATQGAYFDVRKAKRFKPVNIPANK